MTTTPAGHLPPVVLSGYVAGDGLDDAAVWTVEVHLEGCAVCRAELAATLDGPGSDPAGSGPVTGASMLRDVAAALDRRLDAEPVPAPPPARWWMARRWAVRSTLPWLAMTAAVLLIALGLDLVARETERLQPSLVLLAAPVLPLFGVAAAWNRRTDPAWELLAAAPRTGLWMLLRRTVAVLAVVVPMLAAAGWVVGYSPVRWLLPCLGVTTATLALGSRIGVPRAAAAVAAGWVGAVVLPALFLDRLPPALLPAALPVWALAAAAGAALVLLRRRAYDGWSGGF